MNDLVKISVPSLQMSETELCNVLQSSLYPGATMDSIKLVIGWCKAQNKDPLKRPVHIVPMSVKKPGTKDEYVWRDVLMPGIGDYRIDAARTGEYAGIGDARFGNDVTEKLGGVDITYPEWCEIEVFRMVKGQRCGFSSGRIYWKETYATAKRDTEAPNAMWKKRPRGQLEKCAEAMALRRAFPEVGAQPTAEELEGKVIDDGTIIEHARIEQPKSRSEPSTPADNPGSTSRSAPVESTGSGPVTVEGEKAGTNMRPLTKGQLGVLKAKLENAALSTADFKAKWGVECEEGAMVEINAVLAWISNPTQ